MATYTAGQYEEWRQVGDPAYTGHRGTDPAPSGWSPSSPHGGSISGSSYSSPSGGSTNTNTNTNTSNVNTGSSSGSTRAEADQIYQKYFGRPASDAEYNNWKGMNKTNLENYVSGVYQDVSGISYDGSPITPGQQQTDNQLNGTTNDYVPPISTGNKEVDDRLAELEQLLAEMESKGQVLNPDIEITEEQAAEFLSQAEQEVNPFYAGQLKMAKEGLLRSAGYSEENIQNYERQLARQYGIAQRQIGESAADIGFAQSGLRKRDESELATNVQESINQNRRDVSFGLGTQARQFAKEYGGAETPELNIGAAPRVTGQGTFQTSGQDTPFFELSDSTYGDIIGEQEYQRRGQVKSRASQLEGAYRTQEAINQQRQLTI